MKVVILAGGVGTRISEYTKTIPKPMIKIGNKPLIYFIMKHYAKYGFKDFYIAIGYKGEVIKKFFKKKILDWNVKIIETGRNTMTGGRLKRLKKYLGKKSFMLTYGDGISDVNLDKLLKLHNRHKKLVTLTAVRPPARFGSLKINRNVVEKFKEKTVMDPAHKVKDFVHKFSKREIRFVKVKAKNIGLCPEWHPGAGNRGWLFVDEIVIN